MRRGTYLALCLLAALGLPVAARGEPLAMGREARLYVRGLVAPLSLIGSLIRSDRWAPAFVPTPASPAPGQVGFSWRLRVG